MIDHEFKNNVLSTMKMGFNRLNELELKSCLKMVKINKEEIEKMTKPEMVSKLLFLSSEHLERTTKDVDMKDAKPEPLFYKLAMFCSGELKNELTTLTKNY